MIGNRDYTLFEVVHFGLRLPGVLHSFGDVESVSLSNWSTLKSGASITKLPLADRANNLNKIELFDCRSGLELPNSVSVEDLENLSFYCFGIFTQFKAQG